MLVPIYILSSIVWELQLLHILQHLVLLILLIVASLVVGDEITLVVLIWIFLIWWIMMVCMFLYLMIYLDNLFHKLPFFSVGFYFILLISPGYESFFDVYLTSTDTDFVSFLFTCLMLSLMNRNSSFYYINFSLYDWCFYCGYE